MIELKDAQLSDAAAIARLHAASWQQTYRGIYSDFFLDHEVEKDRAAVWQERLTNPNSQQQVIIALQYHTLVGFACLFLDEDPLYGSLLDNLHIAADWQQAGIGKRLLQACAHRIYEHSKQHQMYLWVYEVNERARRVYEHLGAQHVETVVQPTVSGAQANACRYVWPDVKPLLNMG